MVKKQETQRIGAGGINVAGVCRLLRVPQPQDEETRMAVERRLLTFAAYLRLYVNSREGSC